MVKLPLGVDINNLIDDLRIFSWEAADTLLYYSKIIQDTSNKRNFIENNDHDNPVTIADLKVNEMIIKRISEKNTNINNLVTKNIMKKNPLSVNKDMLATQALSIMNSKKITCLCVHNKKMKNKTIGILTIHNILNANIR